QIPVALSDVPNGLIVVLHLDVPRISRSAIDVYAAIRCELHLPLLRRVPEMPGSTDLEKNRVLGTRQIAEGVYVRLYFTYSRHARCVLCLVGPARWHLT